MLEKPRGMHSKTTYIQTLTKLLRLLVYYSQAEVDFIGLFKIGFHAHDLRKGLLGMLKATIAIV